MKKPVLSPACYVARNATVTGNVTLKDAVSVWFHATIRAETAPITVEAGTNIQDNCVLHTDPGRPMHIGENVTVGHGAILHGCEIGSNSLIGMGSTVLNGAKIGKNCLIGAGSLVTQNTIIPDNSLAFGSPARVVRPIRPTEELANRAGAAGYRTESAEYCADGLFVPGSDYTP